MEKEKLAEEMEAENREKEKLSQSIDGELLEQKLRAKKETLETEQLRFYAKIK